MFAGIFQQRAQWVPSLGGGNELSELEKLRGDQVTQPGIQEERDRRWLSFTAEHTNYAMQFSHSTPALVSPTHPPNCATLAHSPGHSHRDLLKRQIE